jgi:hypothetical protein
MSVELYETHVAAEEVDLLAQNARLLILLIGQRPIEVPPGSSQSVTHRLWITSWAGGYGGGSLVTAVARCQSV